ncbi:MAG: DUF2848 domain-containing protein [Candidatus Korarchaeum sp.]|nr:DUF2848 domain-containing protein [Candidatus Korarchaeum sp.]MDW8035652.1 DUF2848 family protein [Candidatus Korarchaeum sp.]
MRRIDLLLQSREGDLSPISFEFGKLLLGGWSGRSKEEVLAHVEELKKLGVPEPERVPSFFPVSCNLIDSSVRVQVIGDRTSGEVEYVLLVEGGEPKYVTVGSDHTDREVERLSVHLSKQLYPKVIPPLVWRYEEVEDHWDELVLRMSVDGVLSQESKLSSLLPPEDLLKLSGIAVENAVVFSGSISWIGGALRFGRRYSFSLTDPILGRRVGYSYEVVRI